jgi:hypothetical protein
MENEHKITKACGLKFKGLSHRALGEYDKAIQCWKEVVKLL